MPQFAEYGAAAAWLQRNPQVRAIDLLLADQMGIPRGKRVTAAELAEYGVDEVLSDFPFGVREGK